MWNFLMWAGTPFVLALVVMGVGVWQLRRRPGGNRLAAIARRLIGWVFACTGALLLFGASVTALELAQARHRYPPPGVMVAIGDAHIHVWCEGSRATPTVLLIGGGYTQGLWMHPIQVGLKDHWRACTVDRPGMGWSDAGREPHTYDDDIAVLHGALAAAGETPATAVVGHSAGGLLALNYASAYPKEVKAIVALDPTQPGDLLIDWRGQGGSLQGTLQEWLPVFGTMYGLPYIDAFNPLREPSQQWLQKIFGKEWDPLVAWELRPSAQLTELSLIGPMPPHADPLWTVRTPGSLPNQSLLLICRVAEAPNPPAWLHATGRRLENYAALLAFKRTEILSFTPRSELIEAPPGSSHHFLYQESEFTLSHINEYLARVLVPGATSTD